MSALFRVKMWKVGLFKSVFSSIALRKYTHNTVNYICINFTFQVKFQPGHIEEVLEILYLIWNTKEHLLHLPPNLTFWVFNFFFLSFPQIAASYGNAVCIFEPLGINSHKRNCVSVSFIILILFRLLEEAKVCLPVIFIILCWHTTE